MIYWLIQMWLRIRIPSATFSEEDMMDHLPPDRTTKLGTLEKGKWGFYERNP